MHSGFFDQMLVGPWGNEDLPVPQAWLAFWVV